MRDKVDVFMRAQRRRLACCANNNDAMSTTLYMPFDQFIERGKINTPSVMGVTIATRLPLAFHFTFLLTSDITRFP